MTVVVTAWAQHIIAATKWLVGGVNMMVKGRFISILSIGNL